MKIAAVSDDGVTTSQHFGRASVYVVFTVENGEIVSREQREKPGHRQFAGEEHGEGVASFQGHGYDPQSQDRHARMAGAISDCQVLIARGMGAGAYDSLRRAGIRVIMTDEPQIEEAVKAFLSGRLVDHPERLH